MSTCDNCKKEIPVWKNTREINGHKFCSPCFKDLKTKKSKILKQKKAINKTKSVEENKTPAKKNPMVQGIIIVIGIFFLFSGISDLVDFNGADTNQNTPNSNTLTIVDENLANFHQDFFSKTDLQKKELWKKYDGQWVKWTFYIKQVDEDMFGTPLIMGKISKPSQYDISSDVIVRFAEESKSKLLDLNNGQLITVVGKLDRYGDILKTFDLKKSVIKITEKIQHTDTGENSEECQTLKQMCESGMDCQGYTIARNNDLC